MDTKRLFALFVVALLALSILPAAFAQDTALTQERTRLRDRLAEAKQNYIAARDKFLADKSDFLRARQQLVDLKRTNASDDEIIAQGKIVVAKAIDRGISNLDVVKNWLDKIKIEDSQRTDLSAMLDDAISKLEAEKAKVDAATTKQELRDIAKETRDIWKDARATVKKVVGIATSERISYIIKNMENLSAKLDERVAKMEEAGKDTSAIGPLVADFKAKLELANGKYEAAREKYASITTIEGADAIIREAHQLIKESHGYLKEAHADLVNIIKEMRAQKADVSVDALVNETSAETAEASG
ncbi:hypothetical protein COV19_01500 [Candidatus Woesearchaeota archaeon CG10_big_fil_rev_8_21_14_0_10_44_13]|nr:MAG: hypothetical protein COV19_01500 [Candidatus Woesearchaeota archaeon CG10_big_fil_rev_8_21_14_0_10_44_13]